MSRRFFGEAIELTALRLLQAAGLPAERARVVASTLKEAELLGRSTHGLWLLDLYLSDLAQGVMGTGSDHIVLHDHGSSLVWDGRRLSGAWLVHNAMEEGFRRLEHHPVVTVTIKHSHHVGCHAVFLRRATERDLVMLLMDTNPGFKTVAPFGSNQALYSPTPISAGIPTDGDPILIDLSLSSSSLGRALAHHRRGKKLAGKWLLDHQGRPTDDPSVLFADPPGSILPLGGSDVGYKGFGLALMVYALSAGLAGYDADDADDANSSAVFLQLIDPDGFGGRLAFRRAISAFADKCRRSPAVPGGVGVRIPGERAEQSRRRAHAEGVELSEDCVEMLERWARTLDVSNVLG